MYSTLSLLLFTGPLRPGLVVLVKFPFMGKREMFENYLYSKGPGPKKAKTKTKNQGHKKRKYESTNAIL